MYRGPVRRPVSKTSIFPGRHFVPLTCSLVDLEVHRVPDLFNKRRQSSVDILDAALALPVTLRREIDDVSRPGQETRFEDQHLSGEALRAAYMQPRRS